MTALLEKVRNYWERRNCKDIAGFSPVALVTMQYREGDLGCDWFLVEPGIVYPQMSSQLFRWLVSDVHPGCVNKYFSAYRHLSEYEQALAVPLSVCPEDKRGKRAELLEICRLSFTALLREQWGKPIGLHIAGDPEWRSV